jgi:hypothetical protein
MNESLGRKGIYQNIVFDVFKETITKIAAHTETARRLGEIYRLHFQGQSASETRNQQKQASR